MEGGEIGLVDCGLGHGDHGRRPLRSEGVVNGLGDEVRSFSLYSTANWFQKKATAMSAGAKDRFSCVFVGCGRRRTRILWCHSWCERGDRLAYLIAEAVGLVEKFDRVVGGLGQAEELGELRRTVAREARMAVTVLTGQMRSKTKAIITSASRMPIRRSRAGASSVGAEKPVEGYQVIGEGDLQSDVVELTSPATQAEKRATLAVSTNQRGDGVHVGKEDRRLHRDRE